MVQSVPTPDSSLTELPGGGSAIAPPEPDLAAVIETLDQGLVVCDRHQRITAINPAARRLLGLGASPVTAAALTAAVSLYIPGDRTPLPADQFPLWRGLAGETLGDLELAIVPPGGDRSMVLIHSRPLLDASGRLDGAIMSLYDITQRYRAETALRHSNRGLRTQAQQRMEDLRAVNLQLQQAEATLRLFYDLPFLGMAIIAADTQTWVRFNDRLCDMLGYRRDEMQQQLWTDLTHPDDRPRALDQIAQLLAGTIDSSVLETRFVRKDNLIVYTSLELRVILTGDGSPACLVTTIQDITERKLAETALVESETRFRATFEQAAVGIAHVAPDGLLLWLNPALGEILGYFHYELIGESLQGMIHPDDRAIDQRYRDEMLQGQRQSFTWQQRYCCQDRRLIWASLTVSLVRDSMQQPKYFIVVMQDITPAKQAETTLQQYAHRLRGLHDMDRAILTNFEPQDIAQSALQLLSQLLRCPQGMVALFDQDLQRGEILADTGVQRPATMPLFPQRLVLPLGEFVLAQGPRPAAVLRVHSAQQLPSLPTILQRFTATPIQAVMTIPLVVNGDVIGEITLTSPHPAHFSDGHEEVAQEVADHLAIALQNARLFEQVRHDRARLHALSSQLLEAQETERRFLAHELHDEVGQALTAVKLNLHRLDRITDNPRASEPLQDCLTIVDGALQQVRNLSLDLRPSMLDDLGLVPALRWYLNRHADRTGLQVTLACDPPPEGLPLSTETACFRIVQEALTNIARHAQAQTVAITLGQTDHTLHLTIQDDGVGFDLEAVGRAKTEGTSLGLLGMEERGVLIGGQLTITSAPGKGTHIALRVPIRN
ncbi:PAS domain S-box protein [Nodosilinea sp. PGN35]|uniref:PAS domain S-box protein n=1 Tax=Nodosilinea sp. PGN35 TaxID=3020489 RepID=UPI0023B2694C|nr:PAS domain S-box protein [Nodosilinea sp. TSF1-S3]MDF0369472.1 PAS domain S-box protein [Nodosilinea sp. TSF1-S3]